MNPTSPDHEKRKPRERLLVVELSFSKQFLNLLKTQMELPPGTEHYGRSGAQPLGVHEVMEQVEKIL